MAHGKESACNARDLGSIPGLGRSSVEGKSYPLQDSGLENSMNYSPWGRKESDRTERLSLSLSLSRPSIPLPHKERGLDPVLTGHVAPGAPSYGIFYFSFRSNFHD